MTENFVQNFGRNVAFTPASYAEPKTEEEVLELLNRHCGKSIRVVASRHAWSDAINTDGLLISVKHLNHVRVNKEGDSVRVGAGCKVKHLLHQLESHSLTLPSLGLIDEQTIAGATATGTHGSGKNSLSHYICRVRIAHYDSQTGNAKITEIQTGTELQAVRCSLGMLGVIVELEMETRAVYRVQEYTKRHRSLDSILAAEEQNPLQQFYLIPWSWQLFGQHRLETKQPRSRLAGLHRFYWHVGIDWGLHLIIVLLAKIFRSQAMIRGFFRFILPLTIIRNWCVTDDSHRMLTMEHELFRHIEIEIFVARTDLKAALDHIKNTITVFGGQNPSDDLNESIHHRNRGSYFHHYPICIRRVLADDTLISMSSPIEKGNDGDCYAISLICYERPSQREGFFKFSEFLAFSMRSRFNARCHWGKYNPLKRNDNELLYPRLNTFREIVHQFDPDSRFANVWLRDVVLKDVSNAE